MERISLQMIQNIRQWIRESITFKFIVVSILVLLLLIPASMIRSLIAEREVTRNEVIAAVSSQWANEQILTGPVLTIPYLVIYDDQGKTEIIRKYAHFLPAELNIGGEIIPEVRKRSIYEVIVYSSQLRISGSFEKPDFERWKVSEDQILYDEAMLCFGIHDMRGIKEAVVVDLGGRKIGADPGLPVKDIMQTGISVRTGRIDKEKVSFTFNLNLNGSQELSFIPVGKMTRVNLTSKWRHPSFDGAFLPDKRTVGDQGFDAAWSILELNRNYPQQWTGNEYGVMDSKFGVKFLMGVDLYQKADRSAKYAIMFLALTFLIFILSEITLKRHIHPIQYLLIGIALSIFYTLLISLAEQIGFNWAYLIASSAIIILITSYTAGILKSRKMTLFIAAALITLYLFLFTILQLEDYALLMGSIGLFAVVAITMYLSRKIEWYKPIDP